MEDVTSVLLNYPLRGPEVSPGTGDTRLQYSSGLLFGGRYVLAHGSLVSPLQAASNIIARNSKKLSSNTQYNALPTVYVSYEHLVQNSANSNTSESIDGAERDAAVSRGKIIFMWKCDLLEDLMKTAFVDWTIGSKEANVDQQDSTGKQFFSVFVLIDIGDPSTCIGPSSALQGLLRIVAQGPGRGGGLVLRGTPFGHEGFLNTETSGLVCAELGPLLLTDASCALGCEGGPAFHPGDRAGHVGQLFGMVVSSLAWCRGEWVGLGLVGCLGPSLQLLLAERGPLTPVPASLPLFTLLDLIDCSVVVARCGNSWGSAVAVGNGHFLTCSHVVRKHCSEKLSLYCLGQEAPATVVHRTPDNEVYDLALLHSPQLTNAKPIHIAPASAVRGEKVVAVGFPYFSIHQVSSLRPLVTRGTVSRSTPSMVQSSCCVQSGCSGGALLRISAPPTPPELLGIIVNNTRNPQDNTKFPNLNMAIPASVFRRNVLSYIENPNSTVLDFQEKRVNIQSQWLLQQEKSKL